MTSVLACAAMCGAKTEGVAVNSTEFIFVSGARVSDGNYDWGIGTAGSTTMPAFSVLALACFADRPVQARMEGGVFQDHVPSPYHLQPVLALLLPRMGVMVHLEVARPGYVPQGAGVLQLRVAPVSRQLTALTLAEPGAKREASLWPAIIRSDI